VRVPILLYHRVDRLAPGLPAITRGLTVDPSAFAAQVAWLHANGFHAIAQRQLYAALLDGARLPPKPVLITFDDGYRDVLEYAAPVLARLRMPATMYVITDRTSRDRPFLGWAGLKALERDGFDIGSHTVDHVDLTTLDAHDLRYQLRGSKWALERGLGHPVPWLAYPFGAENARVAADARRVGYLLAVTERPGSDQPADDPLELRRERVLDTTTLSDLTALVR
jgi:peptidoglycan/xylan/chitin deacetylase (PgdA/CDA1 family)